MVPTRHTYVHNMYVSVLDNITMFLVIVERFNGIL